MTELAFWERRFSPTTSISLALDLETAFVFGLRTGISTPPAWAGTTWHDVALYFGPLVITFTMYRS